MDRREFLKRGLGAAVASSALLSGCLQKETQVQDGLDGGGEMTLRTNPNTGDRISLLGYGMMRLPVVGGGTARENPNSPIDQEQVNALVDYAIEHGVNYFDTSPAYCQGQSEHSTGIALARHPRHKYYIATKLSNYGISTWSHKESQRMFEHSLAELQTDHIDYLLLHGIGMSAEGHTAMESFEGRFINNGMLDWLMEQRRQGRIRNVGFSYHGDLSVFNLLLQWHDEGRYHWDFAQIEMNYYDWHYAERATPRNSGKDSTGGVTNTNADKLYQALHSRHIPITVMEPLLGGKLASLPHSLAMQLKRQEPESPIARWAFRFVGSHDGILAVLSGMTYKEHLQQNVATFSPLRPLTESDHQLLMRIADELLKLNTVPCTGCQYCMPCPYGLNIPAVFSHFNKCLTESDLISGQLPDNEYHRQRRQFLIGYDRSVPRLRQADHCIGCGHCMPHCPQGIDIPQQMQRIDQFVESLKRKG